MIHRAIKAYKRERQERRADGACDPRLDFWLAMIFVEGLVGVR